MDGGNGPVSILSREDGDRPGESSRLLIWISRIWFVRGVLGGLAFISFVTSLTDFSKFEVTRAILAAVAGYQYVAEKVVDALGVWIDLPEFEPLVIDVILLALTTIPSAFVLTGRVLGSVIGHSMASEDGILAGLLNLIMKLSLLGVAFFFSIVLFVPLHRSLTTPEIVDSSDYEALIFFFVAFCCWFLYLSSAFRRGVATLAGFFALVIVLYLVNGGEVKRQINAFACEVLPARCATG